jgi:hypothetical protein
MVRSAATPRVSNHEADGRAATRNLKCRTLRSGEIAEAVSPFSYLMYFLDRAPRESKAKK